MADSPENLDPKEATEAKLCAYLEGELSPADRIEIEKHLAANPQHRKLLAELAKTREWMRSVPNESAPADLAEIFQQQVERSLLLDDSASDSRSSMNRWPQVLLVAAILLLTVGLGAVIVAMLRPPVNGKTFSLVKSPAPTATTEPVIDRSRANNSVLADAAPFPAATMSPAMSTALGGAAPLAPAGAVAVDKLASPSRELLDVSSAASVSAKLALAGYHLPTDQKTVCFVVSTDATSTTVSQVRGFFGRHDLAFDDALTGKHEAADETLSQLPENKPLGVEAAKIVATTAPTSAPSEAIYVAHGLTALQLELLSASLSTDNLNQTVKRLTLNDAPATEPIVAATGSIAKGQMLSVTIPQLVGPGIEKTNLTKVADDGTISLPMIDPLPAAGAMPGELEQRIAAKYREANLIPQATVTVQIPATTQPASAATQPSTMPAMPSVAATQPSTMPIVLAPPATQPVYENSGINVVVMIENSKPQ